MTIEDRTQYTTDEITKRLAAVHVEAVAIDVNTYRSWPLAPQHRYGFLPVVKHEEAVPPKLIAPFCPELIAASGALYEDDVFVAYVDVIVLNLLEHTKRFLATPDGDERHLEIVDFLMDEAPDHYRLLTTAQMHALDSGLVTT